MDTSVIIYFLFIAISTGIDLSLDKSRYEDGKKEYELLSQLSQLPRYGICWKNAMITIQSDCKHLTEDIQGRLSLAYLNCFLEFQRQPIYECDSDQPIHECIRDMKDVDRGSFTTFFTHTQNICYFLQAQVWAEATENTIDRLSDSSSKVASKLEDSNILQAQVLHMQEESMKNQEKIMSQASNLSNVISLSSENIHALFEDYKKTTKEQQLLMADVFERITKLHHLVIGEFSGFYSMVYYALSVIVCYLLTSTPRTSNARFWLFGVMTVNMLAEQMVSSPGFLEYLPFGSYADEKEMIYGYKRLCRRISTALGILILCICAYFYKDLNAINNQLLIKICKQISELKPCLMDSAAASPIKSLTSTENQINVEPPRYFLRERKPVSTSQNPATKVESPNSFAKTVRHLEQITKKNLARAVLRKDKSKT